MTWKLKRTRQCAKCPWKVATNPEEIPNGYSIARHLSLENTIAREGEIAPSPMRPAMACHEHLPGEEAHCIGWLHNQMGPGNNIPLRMHLRECENLGEISLDGPQHDTFADTLPQTLREPMKKKLSKDEL